MDVFEILRLTLQTLLLESENHENPLEKLCEIAGMTKPGVVSTAIQLMETKKVRQLKVKMTEKYRKRRRCFEEFTEKTVFDRNTEISILRRNRRRTALIQLENPIFYEVEHTKKKENLQFLYPKIHFCPCKFFQIAVLDRQTEWICSHLMALYLSISFEKFEIVDCNPEITTILRKILLRAVEEDGKDEMEEKAERNWKKTNRIMRF